MSAAKRIRPRPPMRAALAIVGALAAVAAIVAWTSGSSAYGHATALGEPPPEWAENAGSWPSHNYDLANTRATTQTPINARTVANLKVKWRFRFTGASAFGIFASAPIVLSGVIYLQDLNSNVYAIDRSSGKLVWRHTFNKPSVGPNGVAYGWGRIYGATVTNAFALDAKSGRLLWSRKLNRNKNDGIDIAPQLYDNTVLISTVPGSGVTSFYRGGALGVVWALDAATGKPKWRFNTVKDGKLWGNPKINSGGGPTDDKPTVTLTTPPDANRTSAFLNVRVADIGKVYEEWSAKGAEFLTEPKDHSREIRAYIRDPDGHLIEVGQTVGTPR
jgi:outer membrane protein assembly factor BamB